LLKIKATTIYVTMKTEALSMGSDRCMKQGRILQFDPPTTAHDIADRFQVGLSAPPMNF
jgi:ABC-type sugar transport system ATPase subunit